jgi:hypothetical protein
MTAGARATATALSRMKSQRVRHELAGRMRSKGCGGGEGEKQE